ncbi:ring-cleaving dioxygenase [Paenalkalicoccus suaedae]|uniref:Ring-cleaving dioxygenase n=1 Tax=Paenalkalicoccus suaedae TaxID=2592382 RepID=A0A859FCR1_9BACI|nr:ring-cleaving dioxygenase [Paenalkalicoccus suaedae]QKS70542.1 ring-cleaving dioxygenase [Paenalkalicoccus suaedae]
MTAPTIAGIHHITAIVGNPQRNMDFYADVLGLKFVKKTVNFDDPATYHFYFGNEQGSPGTIITFFPWDGARKGKIGTGQVGTTTFVVPDGALSFWEERLRDKGVKAELATRFNEEYLQFLDPDGLQLEIVARGKGPNSEWEFDTITTNEAIKGFGGTVLYSSDPEATSKLLVEHFRMTHVATAGDFIRFEAPGDLGNIIDIDTSKTEPGSMGVGTVHHIAFRANDDEHQQDIMSYLHSKDIRTTEVKDRQYFNAIYFREPGSILYEVATDPPGFLWDEDQEELGKDLKLPPWLEEQREKIESIIAPITIPEKK